MRGFEQQVANAVRAGQTVRYEVIPIYRGSELVPARRYAAGDGQRRLPARCDRSYNRVP